jgi:hypothetical protein
MKTALCKPMLGAACGVFETFMIRVEVGAAASRSTTFRAALPFHASRIARSAMDH